jgi:hypothetical protein
MFYKALGYLVWKGAKLYVGRKLPALPSRKLVLAGALAVGVATLVAFGAKHASSE